MGFDPVTGLVDRPVPESEPPMQAILGVWATLNEREKAAWHDFTCLNSREPTIMKLAASIAERMQAALSQLAH